MRMPIETSVDDTLRMGKADELLDADEQDGLLSNGYLRRVYRTTLWAWAVLAAVLFTNQGLPAFLGLTMGTVIAVGSLRLLELTVLLFLRPGVVTRPNQVAVLLNLKLPLLTVLLAGAVWASMVGVANIFALVGGIVLVQGVIVLKAVGAWLLTIMPPAAVPTVQPVKPTERAPASRPKPLPVPDQV
jgi:hypothetical protein